MGGDVVGLGPGGLAKLDGVFQAEDLRAVADHLESLWPKAATADADGMAVPEDGGAGAGVTDLPEGLEECGGHIRFEENGVVLGGFFVIEELRLVTSHMEALWHDATANDFADRAVAEDREKLAGELESRLAHEQPCGCQECQTMLLAIGVVRGEP